MIAVYNDLKRKGDKDDRLFRSMVEEFFEGHRYLNFTNALVWLKEVSPQNSAGEPLYECAVEVRLPSQEPVYVAKESNSPLNAAREALDVVKVECLRRWERIHDRRHGQGYAQP